MRRLIAGFLGVMVVFGGVHGAYSTVIQTEVNPANGHTYHLLASSKWTDAQSEAVSLGGHLATINDEAEQSWVWDTFLGSPEGRLLWIGFNDADEEGVFVWVSGESVTYTNWVSSQPSGIGPDEDYVQMGYGGVVDRSGWNDCFDMEFLGGVPLNGVVEVIPEPSTLALLGLGALGLLCWLRSRR